MCRELGFSVQADPEEPGVFRVRLPVGPEPQGTSTAAP
jgi:hypothetical protein